MREVREKMKFYMKHPTTEMDSEGFGWMTIDLRKNKLENVFVYVP